jgi:hypothetical protein
MAQLISLPVAIYFGSTSIDWRCGYTLNRRSPCRRKQRRHEGIRAALGLCLLGENE